VDIGALYSDAQTIRSLSCSEAIKVRMLTALLGADANAWRVVGVTRAALDRFAANEFRRVSGMGVNRAHLVDRHQTYTDILSRDMDVEEWWAFLQERDKCVLATSSENLKNDFGRIIGVDPALGLFRNQGFAWRHGAREAEFLRALYHSGEGKTDALPS